MQSKRTPKPLTLGEFIARAYSAIPTRNAAAFVRLLLLTGVVKVQSSTKD